MPLHYEPNSLHKISLISISRNFDYLCYRCNTRTEMIKMMEDGTYLNVESPFKHLPSRILECLMEQLKGVHSIRFLARTHLHMTVQPQMEGLFLQDGVRDVHFCTQLIYHNKLKNLKRLNLSYIRQLGPSMLIRLFSHLPRLVIINLNTTETVDQVLEAIGQYCPDIQNLNICNTPITNEGLSMLCYNNTNNTTRCRKLRKLSIDGCMISPKPVSFLLLKLPWLFEIDYDRMVQVFNMLSGGGVCINSNEDFNQLNLQVFISNGEYVGDTSLDVVLNLCPNLQNMTFYNTKLQNDVFYKLMCLDYLGHLRLTNTENMSLDFQEGVLPFLTARGTQLISLLLAKFALVDVAIIGECCPKLQNLALSNITQYEELLYPKETIFTELAALELWSELRIDSLSTLVLKQLIMFSKNLKNILVSSVLAFSDSLLHQIWQCNTMKELERLTVDRCPNFTSHSLNDLLDATNNLTLVRVWGCMMIGTTDHQKLQERIKKENYDLYLEWFAWQG